MKTLRLDLPSGISGDMFLGLLLDLGADPGVVAASVRSAAGERTGLDVKRVVKAGISATKATVLLDGIPADDHAPPAAGGHQHGHHHHEHGEGEHHHGHGIAEIMSRIDGAAISMGARDRARAAFERLIDAEASVHGVAREAIHLHEAGAADAVGEIVGAAVALENLGVDRIVHGPIPWGSGTVKMHHGIYPNPAPATAHLLEGRSTIRVPETFEIVTPTGAAILAAWAEEDRGGVFRPTRTGYGAGTKDLDRANVLRGSICESPGGDRVAVLETNLDDVTGETMGHLIERLMVEGALDASAMPIQMKKSRPGLRLTVIAAPTDAERLARIVMEETGTLGVRIREESRLVQARRTVEVATEFGTVRLIVSDHGAKPEYEDCRRLAGERGVPLETVRRAALRSYGKGEGHA